MKVLGADRTLTRADRIREAVDTPSGTVRRTDDGIAQDLGRRLLNPDLLSSAAFAAYRYRFLFVYVIIGAFSLCWEFVVYRGLERLGLASPYCAFAGVVTGVFVAYWGNVRFNFKVPIAKRHRALSYFVVISFFSWAVQFLLRRRLRNWSYEEARLAISGSVFFVAYLLHRRFSFSDYKKVGVAVYANGIEDIKMIHARIANFADIIHVDIVDATYGHQDQEVRTYRLEVVRAYWPSRPIHVHVMSRAPSRYLHDLLPHADRIYIHVEIDEDVRAVLANIRYAGKQVGLAIATDTPLERIRPYLDLLDGVLFLGISKPGSSGQSFEIATLERTADFNRWAGRSRLDVCVDGGVTERNVGLLSVEIVVSGSSVLKNPDPRRQIMRLQTSSSYEQI
jgi:ribulose-phosphate 3-epimerase